MMTRDEILNATPERLNELIALAKGYQYRMMYVETHVANRDWKGWAADTGIGLRMRVDALDLLPTAPPRTEYHYWLRLVHPDDNWLVWEQTEEYDGRDDIKRDHLLERVPNWSGDIGEAWYLVEEMIGDEGQRHWYLESWGRGTKQGDWSATLFTGRGFDAVVGDAGTAPMAICRAYLLVAMEGE